MTTAQWISGGSGNWSSGADWAANTPPAAGDDVVINAAPTSGSYTVSVDGADTANSLGVISAATVAILGNDSLTLQAGTGAGANAGTIAIADSATLTTQGVMDNTGTISLGAAPPTGPLFVPGSTFTVTAQASPDSFTATVPLADGTTALDNGTVDLTVAIVPDGANDWLTFTYTTTNGAPLSSGGDWSMYETGLDAAQPVNFGAAYAAFFTNGTTDTPTYSFFGGYSVAPNPVPGATGTGLYGGGFVDPLPAGPVPQLGSYIDPWSSYLDGAGIDSTTVTGYEEGLEFSPSAVASTLVVGGATATLSGGGIVQLDNVASQLAAATAGDQLVNVDNVIAGSGTIGVGGLAFDNQAAGIVDADGASLLILNTAGQAVSNEGFIESTGGGGLQITGNTTVANTGSIVASGANVYLDNATIDGGTLGSTTGSFIVDNGDTATLSGVTLASGTQITVSNAATLTLLGSVAGSATIVVSGSNATLVLGNAPPALQLAADPWGLDSADTAAALGFAPAVTPAPVASTVPAAPPGGSLLADHHAAPLLPAHHAGGF
jgi:hypothetical protein